MELRLDGKTALVTGAGSGIGRAAALAFARAGGRVALLGRTEQDLREVAAEIEGGDDPLVLTADVSNEEVMRQAFDRIAQRWQRLDVVVANAGINGLWAPLDELPLEEWNRTISINLTGTFLTAKLALPLMREHGGSIIITSSVNGNRIFSNSGATAYSCTKAAQVAFAKMTALELARHHIRVNAVCPGWIETEIEDNTEQRNLEGLRPRVEFPEGRIPLNNGKPGSADDVARLMLFLASDLSSHVTGTEIYIDGAESLIQG